MSEPLPTDPRAGAAAGAAAAAAAAAVKAYSFQPPSEDLVAAITLLARHAYTLEGACCGAKCWQCVCFVLCRHGMEVDGSNPGTWRGVKFWQYGCSMTHVR